MINPIRAMIEQLQLTPRAFAVFNGLSLDTVKAALNGKCRKPPVKVKEALVRAGLSVDRLDEEYAEWLLWRAEEDVRQLRQSK